MLGITMQHLAFVNEAYWILPMKHIVYYKCSILDIANEVYWILQMKHIGYYKWSILNITNEAHWILQIKSYSLFTLFFWILKIHYDIDADHVSGIANKIHWLLQMKYIGYHK